MARRKNENWNLPEQGFDWGHAKIAVLMDIRDALQSIDQKLGCYRIPRALDAVVRIDRRIKKKIKLP